jgi:hypothetical protein
MSRPGFTVAEKAGMRLAPCRSSTLVEAAVTVMSGAGRVEFEQLVDDHV